MNVIDFLKTNSLEDLKKKYKINYNIDLKKRLVILNYTQNSNYVISKECRSLILSLDFQTIISRSFDRFYNYKDKNKFEGKCYCYEKIDGSLIKFYYYENQWNISTRGTIFADNSICSLNKKSIKYKKPLTYQKAVFASLLLNNNSEFQTFCKENNLNQNYTYNFELTGKDIQIVKTYNTEKYELWLLGIRENHTGNYIDIENETLNKIILNPKKYIFNNIEESIEFVNNLNNLDEGFVIYDNETHYPLFKLKSPKYIEKHHLTTSPKNKTNNIYSLYCNSEWKEVIIYKPEMKEEFKNIDLKVKNYFETIQKKYDSLNIKSSNDYKLLLDDNWKFLAIKTHQEQIKDKQEQITLYDMFLNSTQQKKINLVKYIVEN